MAIFGWISLVAIALMVSAPVVIILISHGGRWTIGGANNSRTTRFFANAVAIGMLFAWYYIFAYSPFTLELK